ncbi:MAG: LysM peptidoglycan-binding domain-containing protein [Candidatus Nanopelagicales bacterium]|nr:LysM peptidoglycan-binding domain-containing protein [Actinomycetota bacterium]MBT5501231.1 LysM peptidoglycan-binding domain-containing protein [Actinomycetota bacterium]MBT5806006.1 LysM peptidoglycan-binding domain-containing protein [Actinomycetota bacterium]NCG02796.1 LysM peptidoglycan-binding domain-containing protein [Actinomycetales bacterium]
MNVHHPASASIVLTTRGRVVLGIVMTCAVLCMWVLFGSGTADAASESSLPTTQVVVVQPGESLWSISQSLNPGADPRALIMGIREINGIGTEHVFPGQSLIIPISG